MTRAGRLSLTSERRLATIAVAAIIGTISVPRLMAQSDASISVNPSGPKFEVASVKPARNIQEVMQAGLKPHVGITVNAARVDIGYWSILQLIARAYRIQPYQLSGPDWIGSARFDVQATLPQGSSEKQLPEMLQWLLAERFGMVAHAGTRELPGFALRLGKGGPKMKTAPSEPDADSAAKQEEANTLDLLWGSTGKQAFGLTSISSSANGDQHMQFQKLPMPVLAQILTSYLRAPVADLTGLEGKYQVTLDFSPRTAQPAQAPLGDGDSSDNDLITAVKRLGLKLERHPVRCKVLIVDRLERAPTSN